MQSKATTVEQYLAELPEDRRKAIEAVRQVILKNLDKDYEEGIQYGMIGYYVPHRVYPAGYHCDPKQPLPFAGLASQKNYMSLYLMCVYGDSMIPVVSTSLGQDRQEARHGQVVRAVQEAGRHCARRDRRGDPARAGEEVHQTLRGHCQADEQAGGRGRGRSQRVIKIAQTREFADPGAKTFPRDEVKTARPRLRDSGPTPAHPGAQDDHETRVPTQVHAHA